MSLQRHRLRIAPEPCVKRRAVRRLARGRWGRSEHRPALYRHYWVSDLQYACSKFLDTQIDVAIIAVGSMILVCACFHRTAGLPLPHFPQDPSSLLHLECALLGTLHRITKQLLQFARQAILNQTLLVQSCLERIFVCYPSHCKEPLKAGN